VLDVDGMRARAPEKFREMFGEPLPAAALPVPRLPASWVRYFTESSQTYDETMEMVLRYVERVGSPRRWKDATPRQAIALQSA
jgi:hypothetical protein